MKSALAQKQAGQELNCFFAGGSPCLNSKLLVGLANISPDWHPQFSECGTPAGLFRPLE
jgi:hypothetical protein